MGEKRTLIITDLHGCYDECIQLLDKMAFDEENDTLINLGDTIDRGPKIYETFTFLRDLKERMGDPGKSRADDARRHRERRQ